MSYIALPMEKCAAVERKTSLERDGSCEDCGRVRCIHQDLSAPIVHLSGYNVKRSSSATSMERHCSSFPSRFGFF